jgi:DNA-binding XRE family transcriptional regulator
MSIELAIFKDSMAYFGGARPKTPLNSPQKVTKDTPTKVSLSVRLPHGDSNDTCVLCDTVIIKARERCRLFENALTKAKTCIKLECALSITVDSVFYQSIVCRHCERRFSSLEKTENECKQARIFFGNNYKKTLKQLKDKCEYTVKRMANTTPVKAKKKMMYGSMAEKENSPAVSASLKHPLFSKPPAQQLVDETPSKVMVSYIQWHIILGVVHYLSQGL